MSYNDVRPSSRNFHGYTVFLVPANEILRPTDIYWNDWSDSWELCLYPDRRCGDRTYYRATKEALAQVEKAFRYEELAALQDKLAKLEEETKQCHKDIYDLKASIYSKDAQPSRRTVQDRE
jgi:hypothetical protein